MKVRKLPASKEICLWKSKIPSMSNDHYWLIHIDDLQDGLGLGSEDFVPLFSQKWEYWVAFEYKHYKELPAIFSSVIDGKDIKIKVGKYPNSNAFAFAKWENFGEGYKQPYELARGSVASSLLQKEVSKVNFDKKVIAPVRALFFSVLVLWCLFVLVLLVLVFLNFLSGGSTFNIDPADLYRI